MLARKYVDANIGILLLTSKNIISRHIHVARVRIIETQTRSSFTLLYVVKFGPFRIKTIKDCAKSYKLCQLFAAGLKQIDLFDLLLEMKYS